MEKGVPIRSLSRGIAVLQAVNRGNALSMMEIARSSEVPYPTACRIVQTLLHEGLIEREPARKRYRPTALVQALAHGFQGDAQLVRAARTHIVDLTRRVGWPISLSTQVGHSMVIRDSTHALTALTFSHYHPGFTLPILECAAGHAYLANIGGAERDELFRAIKLLPKRVNMHVIDLMENGELVEQIRSAGFATRGYNQFTRNPGKTSSIAVPIMTKNGAVAGALTLAFFASATRMSDAVAQFVAPLHATAQAISDDMG
jgi:IclR family mhp operon transcriptional activator